MNTLITDLTYDGVVKDLSVLQSIGVDTSFNFTELDLDKGKDKDNTKGVKREICDLTGIVRIDTNNTTPTVPKSRKKKNVVVVEEETDEDLLHITNNIESLANNLLLEVMEIKARILQKKQRKLDSQHVLKQE